MFQLMPSQSPSQLSSAFSGNFYNQPPACKSMMHYAQVVDLYGPAIQTTCLYATSPWLLLLPN